jgi:hypothetical protein
MARVQCRPVPPLTENTIALYWAKLDRRGPDECWLWTGFQNPKGYGMFRVNKLIFLAHRIAYFLGYGVDPGPLLLVCHKCDQPLCQNPAHLFLGTNDENMQDAKSKGRILFGESQPNAKLKEAEIIEIRRLYASGLRLREIAAKLSVPLGTIGVIVCRRTWRHVV